MLALTRAALTFVQPALGMGIFLLLAFAWFGLDEQPRTADIVAAAALAAGIAMITVRAPALGHTINWSHAAVPVVLLTAVAIVPYVLRMRDRPVALAIATGAAFAITGLTSEIVSQGLNQGRPMLIVGGLVLSVAFGLLGFLAQTSALMSGRVTSVVPIVMLLDSAVPVALAPFVFGERWPSGPGRAAVLVAGLVLAIAGAAGLARSPHVGRVRERASGV